MSTGQTKVSGTSEHDDGGDGAQTLLLPKVSVVVVNHNYGRFLEGACRSIARQTYPNIEVVIVDDKSTDDSVAAIDAICEGDAGVIAIKLPTNVGQSIASLKGLSASSGSYVVFLDADDQLLPECVEAHIYAHLSSRIPVAFTTVDILNNVSGQDVTMSHDGFSRYVESGSGLRPKTVRRIDESMPHSWFGRRQPVVAVDQLHFVMPPHAEPWVWSPASANCYRRDAVALLLRESSPGLAQWRWGTDAYLIRPLSGLFGSILIDRPLVRYVIHSDNCFTKGAPLNGFHFFETGSTSDHIRTMTRLAVEQLMADVAENGHQYAEPRIFFEAMRSLSDSFPGPEPGEARGDFYDRQLRVHERSLQRGFGRQVVADEFKNRFGFARTWRKVLKKRGLI